VCGHRRDAELTQSKSRIREGIMRKVNRRLVVTGAVLIAAAVGFFVYMLGIAPRSNDAKALMETVGQVSGVAGAIGVVLIALGLRAKKPA
jgi:hypothetical protein